MDFDAKTFIDINVQDFTELFVFPPEIIRYRGDCFLIAFKAIS